MTGVPDPSAVGRRRDVARLAGAPLLLLGLSVGVAGCVAGTAPDPAATRVGGAVAAPTSPAAVAAASGRLRFASPQKVAIGTGLADVSCARPTSCIALDDAGRAYHFDGTRWAGPTVVAGRSVGPGTISVSCASSTLCMAAPTGGDQVAAWNGQAWTAPTTLDGAMGVEAVGCAPTGYCAVVDGEGNAFAYRGLAWQRTSGDWGSVSSISCVSSTFCMSASGGLSRWNGTVWTTPGTFGATSSFTGVSCPTTAFCVAVDQLGQALQWDGQTWSAPVRVEPAGSASVALTAVSCPTTSYCVAVDRAGGVLQWQDGSWTRTDADGSHALTGLSCPTASFCVAVDHRGDVLVGRPAPRRA